MTKRTIVLLGIAVLLGALYVFWFTDWFVQESIQIITTVRAERTMARGKGKAPVYGVSFALNGKYPLTRVAVVQADDLRTNKYPTPLWELISDTHSVPTKVIRYGEAPRGMKPAIPRARAQPLEPGVEYVVIVEAGKLKAQTNFFTREVASAP
jgi:hypothetical protein